MTNWYWIRHGPTHLKSLVGWSDVDVDLSNINRLKKLDDYLPSNYLRQKLFYQIEDICISIAVCNWVEHIT